MNRRIKASILVLMVATSLFLFIPMGNAGFSDYSVSINIEGRNSVFLGESVTLFPVSSASQVYLQIFDKDGVSRYAGSVPSNSNFIFTPTVYGSYTVQASVGSQVSKTSFWLQDTSGLYTAPSTFSWSFQSVDYTLSEVDVAGKIATYTLTASYEGSSFDVEWLSEVFTKLKPTTVTLQKNDAGLIKIVTSSDKNQITSWIMNTCFGLKLRVNGTLEKANTFKWNFANFGSQVLWAAQSFSTSNLVYDFSDMYSSASYGVDTTIDKTGLKLDVLLQMSFDLDPVLFADGLEGGVLNGPWDNGYTDTGTVSISTAIVHNGTYALNSTITGAGYAALAKDLALSTTCYGYNYIYLSDLPTAGNYIECGPQLLDAGWNAPIELRVYNIGGTYQWSIHYLTDAGDLLANSTTPAISAGAWYYAQLGVVVHASAGWAKAWIAPDNVNIEEGSPTISVTALANDDGGGVNQGIIGIGSVSAAMTTSLFVDDARFATEWTAPVVSGDSTAPTYSGLTASTTVSGASCNLGITCTDETALDGGGEYILEFNGSNSSATAFTSTPETVSEAVTLTNTVGSSDTYNWYFSDAAGNWNSTGSQSITLTADTYTVTLSGPASAIVGETVTISISVSRATGVAISSYQLNITQNGGLLFENYAGSDFTFSEGGTAVTHTFSVTGLYDDGSTASVTPTITDLSIPWQTGGGTGGGYTPATTPTPSPSTPPSSNTVPTIPSQPIIQQPNIPTPVIVAIGACMIGLVAIAVYVDRSRGDPFKKLKKHTDVKWPKK